MDWVSFGYGVLAIVTVELTFAFGYYLGHMEVFTR